MIIPPVVSSYTPVYIYQDSTPDTQKCLEQSENADILQKTLQGEQLTDADTQRIAACIAERKESNKTAVIAIIVFIVLTIGGLVLIGLLA